MIWPKAGVPRKSATRQITVKKSKVDFTAVITRHINNAFAEGELDGKSNVHFLHIPNSDKPVKLYCLDVIISVGYRDKSIIGTRFRQWANKVLKEYLLRG